MWSKSLFARVVKENYKLFLLFTGILCLYITVICAVFTPQAFSGMDKIMQSIGAMGNMFGDMSTMTSFISRMFFKMIAVIFPMVYCIVVGNRLIASKVDRGSMSYLLSTPTTRNQVTVTSGVYFIGSLALMFGIMTAAGLGMAAAFQPGELDAKVFLQLALGGFLLQFAISGVCFASSCVFNLSKFSLGLGAGIPLGFFLIQMMSQISDDLEFLKYFTLNTLFDPDAVLKGEGFVLPFLILAAVGVVLYAVGVWVFREKDLPL